MKAHAYEFASIIDRQIEDLSDEEFIQRKGRGKILREELYPLSRLGLYFKQPGLEVEIEGFEGCDKADGKIFIRGYQEKALDVQLTYAGYKYEESLRSELLSHMGFTPLAGQIKRNKIYGSIEATMGAVDVGAHVSRIASEIIECFRKKACKPYADGTILLIAFDEIKFCGRHNWEELLNKLEEGVVTSGTPFSQVYLFNGESNELRRAA